MAVGCSPRPTGTLLIPEVLLGTAAFGVVLVPGDLS